MKRYFVYIIIIVILLGVASYFFFKTQKVGSVIGSEPDEASIIESGNEKIYRAEFLGFTFRVPKNFTIGEFSEAGGRVVLISTDSASVQIFMVDYDEPAETLTFDKIKAEVPTLTVKEPEKLPMTGGKSALAFIGEDTTFGVTREVWLVHRGYLFQITAPLSEQDILAELLNTWELF